MTVKATGKSRCSNATWAFGSSAYASATWHWSRHQVRHRICQVFKGVCVKTHALAPSRSVAALIVALQYAWGLMGSGRKGMTARPARHFTLVSPNHLTQLRTLILLGPAWGPNLPDPQDSQSSTVPIPAARGQRNTWRWKTRALLIAVPFSTEPLCWISTVGRNCIAEL